MQCIYNIYLCYNLHLCSFDMILTNKCSKKYPALEQYRTGMSHRPFSPYFLFPRISFFPLLRSKNGGKYIIRKFTSQILKMVEIYPKNSHINRPWRVHFFKIVSQFRFANLYPIKIEKAHMRREEGGKGFLKLLKHII